MDFYSIHCVPAREAFSIFPKELLREVTRVAFTGTRINGLSAGVANIVTASLRCTLSGKNYKISVGDASGVDAEVREELWQQPHEIFKVTGTERKDFAQRSVRCVQSVLPAEGAVLLAFPDKRCPAKVNTKPRFAGHGSGTWGTVGYALAHHIDVIMYVPPQVDPVKWCGPLKKYATKVTGPGTDRNTPADNGSWLKLSLPPAAKQPTLF